MTIQLSDFGGKVPLYCHISLQIYSFIAKMDLSNLSKNKRLEFWGKTDKYQYFICNWQKFCDILMSIVICPTAVEKSIT